MELYYISGIILNSTALVIPSGFVDETRYEKIVEEYPDNLS
jgi:hypothetical protein